MTDALGQSRHQPSCLLSYCPNSTPPNRKSGVLIELTFVYPWWIGTEWCDECRDPARRGDWEGPVVPVPVVAVEGDLRRHPPQGHYESSDAHDLEHVQGAVRVEERAGWRDYRLCACYRVGPVEVVSAV